jgi:ribonuclease P protein component
MALVVGARWGDAVTRNRIRRLLRESFRTARGEFPAGFDFALLPRGALAAKSMEEVRARLVSAARGAVRRWQAEGPATPKPGVRRR